MSSLLRRITGLRAPAAAVLWLALGTGLAEAERPGAFPKRRREPVVNQRIESHIEQHRQGDATLDVVDAAGKPARGFHGNHSVTITSSGAIRIFPFELKSSAVLNHITLNLK